MTPELFQTLLPGILSIATPHVAAVLNDPRPNRRWLRLLVSLLLVLGGAALEIVQSGAWNLETYLRNVGVLFIGSQMVFRFLRDAYLGKLETVTGNGLGALLDLGKSGRSEVSHADIRLRNLKGLLDEHLITQEEYDSRRSEILGDV
jgi:hypothetical protein